MIYNLSMEIDSILRNRYRVRQFLGHEQLELIAISMYLAENLEMPISPKPLCVIYCWQVHQQDFLDHQAIATKLYEIGQKYTLAPKVQTFFKEDEYYYLIREYLEGYTYLDEFRQIVNDSNLSANIRKPQDESDISTVKALAIVKSLTQIPIKLNRRQLITHASTAIFGFTLALFLEKLKPQPQTITIAEIPKIPELPREPIKRGDKAFRDNLGNGIYMEMVKIPSGKFVLGSPNNELGRRSNESPLVEINISNFYMAKFPVTQEQWITIMGSNPAKFRENLQAPIENISWLEAQDFCRRLSAQSSYSYLYRLPSESEWEYGCRAGANTAYHFGDNPDQLSDYAWFADNANKRSQPVGQKVPNPWGLYEMQGSVWEWCEDNWHDNFIGTPTGGKPWTDENSVQRVRKGGSWSNKSELCRSASREWHHQGDRYNDIGLRVVISAKTN